MTRDSKVYCLSIVVLQELQELITSPSFIALHLPVSEIAKVLPEGVFNKNYMYIVYYNVYHDCFGVFIEKHVFRLDWWLLHAHVCPYCNVWPQAVYFFARTIYNIYRVVYITVIGFYHFTKVRCSKSSSF